MNIYNKLSKISLLKRYSYKFLFVAFIGIHIPLIGIIAFVIITQGEALSPSMIIVISLILTLLATGVTLYFLDKLLAPLTQSKNALESYVNNAELPNLPTNYKDEAGILMQQLQFALLKLDELVKAKDDLVSVISHDIRTPLSHMISYAELIKSSGSGEKESKYADKIITSGNQQLSMLESLLNLLQQQGMSISDMDKVNLSILELVNEALEEHHNPIQSKALIIKMEIDPSLKIKVNHSLFSHVVQNLISNACKFSNSGDQITISGIKTQNGYTELQVSDNGIGFEPTASKGIFDKFTKQGQKGTEGEVSTGLGLYVSKTIVEKHNGKISASSKGKDKGATFIVSLPD